MPTTPDTRARARRSALKQSSAAMTALEHQQDLVAVVHEAVTKVSGLEDQIIQMRLAAVEAVEELQNEGYAPKAIAAQAGTTEQMIKDILKAKVSASKKNRTVKKDEPVPVVLPEIPQTNPEPEVGLPSIPPMPRF